ncbi:hypothetical protein DV515_00006902 [Chloebia gouldiae]|uniref:Uncharacterized protein n=1 Tax=Chloebia gouldiae TaxID=44316 RepID=A0A3L8SK41_CHLGU|nr:hypothetical protein DV515_00006902 [Chloebia gouldiae]
MCPATQSTFQCSPRLQFGSRPCTAPCPPRLLGLCHNSCRSLFPEAFLEGGDGALINTFLLYPTLLNTCGVEHLREDRKINRMEIMRKWRMTKKKKAVLLCKLATSAQIYFHNHLPQLNAQRAAKTRWTGNQGSGIHHFSHASLSVALALCDLNKDQRGLKSKPKLLEKSQEAPLLDVGEQFSSGLLTHNFANQADISLGKRN